MASKSLLLVFILLVATAAVTVPVGEAQLLGGILGPGGILGGIVGSIGGIVGSIGGIVGGIVGPILGLLRIQGTVYCTPTGNVGVNGIATPVFANALVQMRCGGNVVSSTRTNDSGMFSIVLKSSVALSNVVEACNVVVARPLGSCNGNLPSGGGLVSKLQVVGSTAPGVFNVVPAGFGFDATLT